MLTIDRLHLQLPPAFRDRAGEIARLVAEELATVPMTADLQLDRLAVPPVEISPLATDRDVARAVAASVHKGIRNETR
ncbi:hypothetical protein SAMN04489760_103112 [Syntrophus gentianae]|uniref:Uncharacterized protein n=1 Tax=Syntrophus gentianae TaxID=43775 RepID=A0A1H7V9D1_9BACT|nr:hypothetical protein [Syntrophus gentianae]SEM05822.1 hypothetical protein SAMN04489760_103112 [Syntrophus gentianae]